MDAVKAPPLVWGAFVLVGVFSVGASWKTSHDTGQTNDDVQATQAQVIKNQACLFGFMAENSRVSKVRSAATGARDEAINRLLSGVARLTLNPDPDPVRVQQTYKDLLSEYQVAAKRLKAERAKNPLPELPASCADLPE